MEGWKKILLYAGGAAGAAAVLYYLLREDEAKPAGADAGVGGGKGKESKLKVEDVTKEQVRQILNEIVESQEKMRAHMKSVTSQLCAKPEPFEQTYQRIKEVQPEDPLERYGLSMMDFDNLLNKHQHDPQVRDGITKIMGVPDSAGKAGAAGKGPSVTAKRIIEVHSFMLEELDRLVKHFSTVKNKENYEMKTVTLAAQAVVGAKVEDKFGLTSEDIERAVMEHHTTLATDQEFANVNMRMQSTMAQLMGHDGQ